MAKKRATKKKAATLPTKKVQKKKVKEAPRLESGRQVFVAYSYKLYPKADYRKIYKALEKRYHVTFIFADEKITNMHIMKKIETFIRASDFSIFDISGWNPNVTLELGYAMALADNWYIAIDPSKTETKEVPSDLRGLDRIQYSSYSELEEKLGTVMEQRYPKRSHEGIDEFLEEKRTEVRDLLAAEPGLTMVSLSQVLGIDVQVAQLVVRPLVEGGELVTEGQRKGMKYYLSGG
ncbi:MAG: hypothetical protein R3D98_12020 [Candidatus Krumholzibacteriia bacterium]